MHYDDCGGKIIMDVSNDWGRLPYHRCINGRLKISESRNTDGDIKAKINTDCYIPRKIIFNDPVSVVFWQDGTKTIVRRTKGEKFNKYTAFTAALAKKIFGNNTRVNAIVKSGIDQKEKDAAKKAKMAKKRTRNHIFEVSSVQ